MKMSKTLIYDKKEIPKVFDKISQHYDFLNRVLSLGLDKIWRRRFLQNIQTSNNDRVLDLASGTGDLCLELLQMGKPVGHIVCVDPAKKMLDLARHKIKKQFPESSVDFIVSGVENLYFPKASFQHIIISFGYRNFPDRIEALKLMKSLIKDDGSIRILELSYPENKILQKIFQFYFEKIMPIIGGLLSPDKKAYTYLNQTAAQFPSPAELREEFLSTGFKVEIENYFLGIIRGYLLSKS